MRKMLAVLMFCLLLFSSAGCSGNADTANGGSAQAAAWPTDKWSTSAPDKQGVDAGMLSNADKRIKANYPNVYSLLVVRHGYLIYEKYYQGMNRNSANPVYSVTKSVISALTGIAIREKLFQNVDQKVSEFLPDYFANADDARKKDITIKDVLTMSGGLEPIDSNYSAYFSSGDWLAYALGKPMTDQPGEKFAYNTGLTHFLSGVITKTSKMTTMDFAEKFLFSKIGLSVKTWDADQNGINGGGSGLMIRPVDMARFGYLYLKKGLWDGNQVIPQDWIAESTEKQISVSPGVDYGYLFWIETMKDTVHGKDYDTYRADGAGGQKIVVIPGLDMVVVVTANYQSSSIDKSDTQAIITDYVLPAVESQGN